jgi:hypothetical protein
MRPSPFHKGSGTNKDDSGPKPSKLGMSSVTEDAPAPAEVCPVGLWDTQHILGCYFAFRVWWATVMLQRQLATDFLQSLGGGR